jgi:hypothetical protein
MHLLCNKYIYWVKRNGDVLAKDWRQYETLQKTRCVLRNFHH